MAKKLPTTPPPKTIQTARDILGVDIVAWREVKDDDDELTGVNVITAQGQKFKFAIAELADPNKTRDDLKKRKVRIFRQLPHGPIRIPQEETFD